MRSATWSSLGLVVALLAAPVSADETDAGPQAPAAEPVADTAAATADAGTPPAPPAAAPADTRAEDAEAARALRVTLMGVDSAFMRSGLLAPPRGSFSLNLEGVGELGCERFSARPDRRPIQVVGEDQSGLHNACYQLGHIELSGEFGLGKRLGAFFSFIPLAVSTLRGGPVNRTAVGVSDLSAGFRLQVFDDDVQGAMVVAVAVPIGRSSTNPPIGPGDFRADFLSYLSKQFDRVPVLVAMGMGMRLRGWAEVNEVSPTTTVIRYSDELRFDVRVAYAFTFEKPWLPALLVALTCDGRWALAPGLEDGLGILNSPTGTTMNVGLEVVARFPYGFRATLKGGQMVAGHSVPILTYFGLGVGIAR